MVSPPSRNDGVGVGVLVGVGVGVLVGAGVGVGVLVGVGVGVLVGSGVGVGVGSGVGVGVGSGVGVGVGVGTGVDGSEDGVVSAPVGSATFSVTFPACALPCLVLPFFLTSGSESPQEEMLMETNSIHKTIKSCFNNRFFEKWFMVYCSLPYRKTITANLPSYLQSRGNLPIRGTWQMPS